MNATRVFGVGIVAALGQFVVDTPGGSFGPVQQGTTVGLLYALTMVLASLGCAAGALAANPRWRWAFAFTTVVGAAFFVPALGTDTVRAGAVMAWMLGSLSQSVAAEAVPARVRRRRPPSLRPAAAQLVALSTFAMLVVVGFELDQGIASRLVTVGLAMLATAAAWIAFPLGRRLLVALGLLVSGAIAAVALGHPTAALALLGISQAVLLAVAVVQSSFARDVVGLLLRRPGLLATSAFAGIALLGALLLSFPAAATGTPLAPLDALFMAMSATCVTGLAVVDPGTAMSPFGEAVLLLLFQVGGLGIMVLSTFATIALGGRLSLRGQQALGEILDLDSPSTAYRLVRFIVLATLALELVGTVVLFGCYLRHGFPVSEAAWRGLFQAVSAFCNAGFSLQSDSIVMFQSDPIALGTHAVLIVLGGLGFVVLAWLANRAPGGQRTRAPVQVRLVLHLSAALIILGAVVYAALEWRATLAGLSTVDKITNAVFQSITTRTAGFNSVDLSSLRPATLLVVLGLMFVGAAPGGTAGGIKITTVAVLAAAIPGVLRGQSDATLYRRSIPAETLQRASTIAVFSATAAALALFALLLTESTGLPALLFETISALGTVGLSIGATAALTSTGKWIVIFTMLVGRVGALTIALAVGRGVRARVRHPPTRIMVG